MASRAAGDEGGAVSGSVAIIDEGTDREAVEVAA